MRRRAFLGLALPVALAGLAYAQETKGKDRLSGKVRSVDKDKSTIQMYMSNNPNTLRTIMYDASTKFTLNGAAANADAVKEGQRIVAVGTFEGVNLKATKISVK